MAEDPSVYEEHAIEIEREPLAAPSHSGTSAPPEASDLPLAAATAVQTPRTGWRVASRG